MSDRKQYAFDNIKILIAHLMSKLDNATPLKIQKSLYFLWAFYSATYGNISYEDKSEFDSQPKYPKELFKADFEAWRYGPVISSVYHENKNGDYKDLKDTYKPRDENSKEIMLFIDDLLSQINDINDFSLVARSHEDSAWKKSYVEDDMHCPMNNQDIKEDYLKYVEKQSEI